MEAILIPGRRADMVIYENDQPFVVEFQASKIEREELIARTKDYSEAKSLYYGFSYQSSEA